MQLHLEGSSSLLLKTHCKTGIGKCKQAMQHFNEISIDADN